MESMKRCLDFHDLMPVDQGFRHQDLNLHQLKAVAVKEVMQVTMILMLDEDHMHYSNAFGNIFEGGCTLCKKHFPNGSGGIKMTKGGAAWAIVCHFCPHACSNNDYAYHHLLAIHLNIQWGCGVCFGYVSGYLSSGNTFSSTTKRALGSIPTHPTRRTGVANQNHPQTESRVTRRGR